MFRAGINVLGKKFFTRYSSPRRVSKAWEDVYGDWLMLPSQYLSRQFASGLSRPFDSLNQVYKYISWLTDLLDLLTYLTYLTYWLTCSSAFQSDHRGAATPYQCDQFRVYFLFNSALDQPTFCAFSSTVLVQVPFDLPTSFFHWRLYSSTSPVWYCYGASAVCPQSRPTFYRRLSSWSVGLCFVLLFRNLRCRLSLAVGSCSWSSRLWKSGACAENLGNALCLSTQRENDFLCA